MKKSAVKKGNGAVALIKKIKSKKAEIGIIGLGYVGLPLVIEFCKAGFPVTGLDVDAEKVAMLRQGKSYIKHIDSSVLAADCMSRFKPTNDFPSLRRWTASSSAFPRR